MATKEQGDSCYEKAAPDEPIFVLRAQDFLAPEIVREWAYRAAVDRMEDWQIAHKRKVPD